MWEVKSLTQEYEINEIDKINKMSKTNKINKINKIDKTSKTGKKIEKLRREVWIAAFSKNVPNSLQYADDMLEEFDKRFPKNI